LILILVTLLEGAAYLGSNIVGDHEK